MVSASIGQAWVRSYSQKGFARDKHSSLIVFGISDDEKHFITLAPVSDFINILLLLFRDIKENIPITCVAKTS